MSAYTTTIIIILITLLSILTITSSLISSITKFITPMNHQRYSSTLHIPTIPPNLPRTSLYSTSAPLILPQNFTELDLVEEVGQQKDSLPLNLSTPPSTPPTTPPPSLASSIFAFTRPHTLYGSLLAIPSLYLTALFTTTQGLPSPKVSRGAEERRSDRILRNTITNHPSRAGFAGAFPLVASLLCSIFSTCS